MKKHDILCKKLKGAKYARKKLNYMIYVCKTLIVAKYARKT